VVGGAVVGGAVVGGAVVVGAAVVAVVPTVARGAVVAVEPGRRVVAVDARPPSASPAASETGGVSASLQAPTAPVSVTLTRPAATSRHALRPPCVVGSSITVSPVLPSTTWLPRLDARHPIDADTATTVTRGRNRNETT
jgi:hypothetical protein